MKQIKWFDRKFEFAQHNIFPSIFERLEGTPIHLAHKLASFSADKIVQRVDEKWTVAENIGHLSDLETLWQLRLHEILEGKKTMSPADLTNQKTWLANHNSKSVVHLLAEFSDLRQQTLSLLAALDESDIFKSALHPRLQTPMTVQDLFIFVAEHDDHHLAQISALKRAF